MNAVTSLTWVRRGVANAHPDLVRLPDSELENLLGSSGKTRDMDGNSDEVDSGDEKRRKKVKDSNAEKSKDSLEARYSLDDYDEDDDSDDNNGAFSMGTISYYTSNQQDPYLSKGNQSSDDESDLNISPDDNLIAMGKVHGEFFSLEVWVTNVAEGSLYCHHDTILSSCPLAIEWVGFDPGELDSASANLVAISNMTPNIELWDLDVVNTLEPAFTLKGKQKSKKKEKASRKVATSRGHSDAVLALSWNTNRHEVLSSASADSLVGVWDLSRGKAVSFLSGHNDKVQAVQWHPVEDQLLISGCYDGCARLFDCRAPSCTPSRHWTLGGEVEKVLWDHHNPFYLFAGTDGGSLVCMDVRSTTPMFSQEAHSSALSALALSPSVDGCLVTASNDCSVKVWDVRGHATADLVRQRVCKIGEIHCAAACPDEPLLFCVGGEFEMKLLNFRHDETVTEKFSAESNDSNTRGSHDSPKKPNTARKSRKTKITDTDLIPATSSTVSESSRTKSADNKVSKKSKPLESNASNVKAKKPKHLKKTLQT